MAGGSREKIEQVAMELLARHGYNGMGLKAVSEAAGLPYGSIYHHFPGGKEQIASSAISSCGDMVGQLIRAVFANGTPEVAVRALFDFMASGLEASGWAQGCPVGTPAGDGPTGSDQIRSACDMAFDHMIRAVADGLVDAGAERAVARGLATAVMAAYEGATTLARVQQSAAPLRATYEALLPLVRAAVAGPPPA